MTLRKSATTRTDIPEVQPETKQDQTLSQRFHTKERGAAEPVRRSTPKKYDLAAFSRKKLINWASYRVPMKVTEGIVVPFYLSETIYYVCPRCHTSMEREYTAYCNCCGQKLDWRGFRKAKLRRAGRNVLAQRAKQMTYV